jgi:hypothetical protein
MAIRTTQTAVEVLTTGVPNLLVTQTAAEVLVTGSPTLRVTQVVVEVLVPNVAAPTPRKVGPPAQMMT